MIFRFKTVFIKLTFILISIFATTSVDAAKIYFNDIYKGTGSSYAEQTNSISSIQFITGSGFTFTSTDPADVTFRLTGNNVAGTLSYINASGVKQSIIGQVSRQDKSGSNTIGLYFYTTTNEAYLLVIPGITSYRANDNVSTSSDPILAVMNDVLTAQNSQPKIAVNDVTVSNTASYAVFTVSLSAAANANISFTPSLTAVTATLNTDYTGSMQYYNGSIWVNISSTVSIAQGTTSLQIRVPILNGGGTSNRTFNLNTGTISGGNILNSDGAYGIGTITPTPSIIVSNNLKTFSTCSGCTVNPQSFTVSGSNLTANITLTAPTSVVLSATSTGTYSSSLSLTQSSGTVTTTTIFAKLTSNVSSISSGVITASSTNATSKTITITTNTDNALNFDGTNDYVSLASGIGTAYNNSAVTIEAWIRTTSLTSSSNFNEIIGWGNTSSAYVNNVVEFRISEGKLQFILNDGTTFYGITSNSLVNTGKWVHVAVVKSGTTVTLYINGQSAAYTGSASASASSNPTINTAKIGVLAYYFSGAYGIRSGSYFSGDIDQVRVWNTAKNSSAILSDMFVEMAGNETGLVANYDFNQGIANGTNTSLTSLTDKAANAYDGTFSGFSLTGTTSNFVTGFIPEITAAGSATSVAAGSTLQLSNSLTGGTWASSNVNYATVDASTGLATGVASGTVTISYTICDKVVSYSLNITQPTITTTGTLKTFTSCSGCTITPQSFTVSGSNLGANVTVTAPSGFEISATVGGTYSSSITLSPTSGTLGTTTIYARLINSSITASNGNITVVSTGAVSKTISATVNTDNAIMFDGVDDYVPLGDVLDVTSLPYSTEAWVYWKGSSNAFSEIFTKDLVQSVAITNGNKLHANFGDGTDWSTGLNSTTLIPLNKWTHIAVTRSNTGVVKMYINGILDASTNTMNITGNNNAVRSIGGKFAGSLNGPFVGAIDNLKVWNVEKSASDIAGGMFTELSGNETDLLAYYNFNQGTANGSNSGISTLLDASNSGLNGTLTNMSKAGTTSNFVDGFIPDIISRDNALNFDGVNDFVSLPTSVVNGLTNFTFETWVKPSIYSGNQRLFDFGLNQNDYMLFTINNGKPFFAISKGTYPNVQGTSDIPLNTWSHLAIVLDATAQTATIYVNGQAVVSGSMPKTPSSLGTITAAYLGTGFYADPNFKGNMDEVRIWSSARTATEIANNYLNKLLGNESGLVAYYNMNQGVANGTNTGLTTLQDKTASAKNGTLNNFVLSTGATSNYVENLLPYTIAQGTTTTISSGADFALTDALTGGTWSSSNPNIATVNSTTGVVTGVAAGSVTITYSICGKTSGYALNIIAPTITTSGTLPVIASCSGCAVNPNSFTVSGINLSNNIIITAPTGVVISTTSTGTYSTSLTLSQSSGSVTNTSIFVKLSNNATANNSGVINITSTGAVSKTMSVTVNTDNALNFDGIDDYVSIPDNNALDVTTNLTLEAWMYPTSNSGSQVVIGKIDAGGNASDLSYALRYNSGNLTFEVGNGTSANNISTTSLALNKWQHVAAVFSGGNMKLYIDGGLITSATVSVTSIKVSTSLLKLGHYNTTFNQNYKGALDEVRVWNVARDASQIQNNYLIELAGNETGLVAYYNFNQGTSNGTNTSISTLLDKGNNNINGTLTNFTRSGTTSNFIAGLLPSITGTATANVGASSTLSNTLTGGNWSSSNTAIATVNSATGAVTGVAAGTSTITYTICDKTVNTLFTVTVPTITTSGTLTAFNTCATTNSAAQTFTVSAQYLTANLVLSAPTGYELATASGGTYSSTISIAPTSGSVSARLIYVRTTTSIVNGQSGNITITSTGATTKNIATGNAVVTQNKTASVTITSNATNNTICSGASITFTANATNGGLTPTYQWKNNGVNISGATSATYTTSTLSSNATITVVMGSSIATCLSGSPATSNAINVTVNNVPNNPGVFTGLSANLSTICMNSNQVYSIAAVTGATSYTWLVTGSLSATASSTTNVINITAANTAGSGTITVFANNACGTSVGNSTLSVSVNNTPAPTANFTASANTICLTSPVVTFTSTSTPNATSSATISTYNWDFGDGNTASTTTPSNTYTSSGNFDVILTIQSTDACTSQVSSRIIVDPISVAGTAAAASATICEGTNTTLSLTGSTGTIQWKSSTDGINFTTISGATASNYTTPNLTATTYYQAVVTSGSCSSATSGVVTVTVSPTPTATLSNITGLLNSSTSFDLAYSNVVGNPNEYSISSVSPNPLPNFTAVNNYGLLGSPITVNIPASASGLYNFNLVLANNTVGCTSSVIPFTVTIAIAAPASLSYSSPNVYTVGTTIANLNPNATGGTIASYSISPGLPAGLTLNTNTGVISGTPSAVSSQTSYVVTGTNASGTVTATVIITVNIAAPASLSYNSPNVYTVGTTIANLNPSSTGGAIASYSISPSLPAGLTINTTTGIISGTPSAVSSQTSYVVTGTNTSGTVTATVIITVNIAAPASLSYNSPNVYTVGTAIANLNPSSTGGAIASYSISPILPAGLTINTTTGIISGTPSAASAQTSYVVTGTNASGTVTATVIITVNIAAPASLSYNSPNVYTVGTTIANLNPSSTGGAIASYSISPILPAGLTINLTTGIISGTPSAASAQTTYTVTGTNASGTVTATVVITVNSGIVPQPQGALNAVDYGLLLSDTVKLKLTTSNGLAPFTLILSNDQTSIKDTIINLTPVNNEIIFTHKRLDTTKVFTIFKLIDANNATRSSGFTKDTTRVNGLTPKILLTLKADPAVKQADNSFKTRLLLKVKNAGDIDLRNVQVNANLSKVFPAGINYVLDSIRVLNGNFALNPTYSGAGNATSASSTESIVATSNNGARKSLAILDQNYLFNNGVNLNKNEEGEIAYYVSIGATTQNVTLKLQFESAGDGVLVKNDGSSSAQGTTSKSDDGTNINQHPDLTNNGLPLPTYVPLIPNVKIGASLAVSSATPVTGGYQYHFIAKIKNYGNVNLDSIRIQYNFNELFPAPDQASLIGNPTITRGNIAYNANTYNGYNDVNLFNYGGDLQVGDSATYEYDLKVTTNRIAYTWPNYFVVYGRSINSGIFVNDTSMTGTNPDPNNDNDPIERVYTNVTINYVPPAPPTVENKTYVYGTVKPANIGGLVKSTPTGSIPVWCDQKTLACSITPPATPTEIGKYIYALRSYDTTTLLYSEVLVYDTVIIKPPVPMVINKKYIIGNSSNPANVSNQVTGMTGSVLNYFKNASLQTTTPTLGTIPGVTRYTTSQTVNGIESDTVGFTVTMLDPKTMLHLQKLADEPKLLANSTFNITYTFIVSNKTEDPMTNVLVADNLLNTFPAPTSFDVVSVSSTGGLLFNSGFNGKTDIQLIKAASTLAAAAVDTIRMTVNLQPKGFNGTVNNVAVVTATTPYGNLNINSSTTGYANETAKLPTPSVIPDLAIDIPEAFSPNRDGVNDKFVILKPFGTTLELEIYNRWGNVVYYNANYNNEWDGRGTNNFIGQDLMDGGYYYTLKTKSVNGNSQIFKGFVLIQR